MSDNTEKYPDQKLVEQLTARIASQNPCCTSAGIMEMVAEEASETRRRWLKEKKHDALYNLEKALPILENTDA